MNKIIDLLDGKKTYIGALVFAVAGILKGFQVTDEATFQVLVAVGTSITAVGLRSAIEKLLNK